jgi:hypothetical protein
VATGSAPQRILAQVRMPARLNHTAVISKHAGRDPKFLVEKRCTPRWRSGFPLRVAAEYEMNVIRWGVTLATFGERKSDKPFRA